MAAGFDRQRMDPVLAGLATDFEDETSGATRRDLREALAYLFFTAEDDATKRFAYRVECETDKIRVDRAGPGPPTAQCEVRARFLDLRGGQETPAWEITVTADLVPGDDGWRVSRTSHVTRSGKVLYR